MQAEILVLRLVHILGGIFWLGSGLFTTLFLLPSLASSWPTAGAVMLGLQKRKLFLWVPIVALFTILSGLRLLWIVSAGDMHVVLHHRATHTYAMSGLLAIVAFLLSLLVSRPSSLKMSGLSQMAASDSASKDRIQAEVVRLRKRATWSSALAMVLLVLAAAGMALARYL